MPLRIRQGLVMLSQIESGLPHSTQKISEVDISDPENLKILLVDDTAEVYLGEKDYLKRFSTLMSNLERIPEVEGSIHGICFDRYAIRQSDRVSSQA